jgi:hypothetical protein
VKKQEMKEQPFKHTRRNRRFIVDEMDIRGIATIPGESGSVLFKVRILSLSGMLMKSRRLYEAESPLHAEMTLPGDLRLSVSCSVTSSLPASDGKGEHYDSGVKFHDLLDQDKTKLKEFIRGLYIKDAGFDS